MPSMQPRINLGGKSSYPILQPDKTIKGPLATVSDPFDSRVIPGFVGDGDYIQLPVSATNTIAYYDKDGTQVTDGVWASGLTVAEIDALANDWCGFALKKSDNLLYVAVYHVSDTVTLATVSAAGVKTSLSTSSSGLVSPGWMQQAAGTNASCMYIEANGDIVLRCNNGDVVEETTWNSAGTVQTPKAVHVASAGCFFKSKRGVYCSFGYFDGDGYSYPVVSMSKGDRALSLAIPPETNIPFCVSQSAIQPYPIYVKGKIVAAVTTSNISGVKSMTEAKLSKWVDEVAKLVGLI